MPAPKPKTETAEETPLGPILSQARNHAKAWSDFAKALDGCFLKGSNDSQPALDPFAIYPVLAQVEHSPIISTTLPPSALAEVKKWAADQRKSVEQSFEARLNEFCDANSIKLDGHFPSYILAGFLRLHANPAKGTCDLGDKHFETLLLDSFTPAILAAIKEESQRPFDKTRFMDELFTAYNRAAVLSKAPAGSALSVKDVFLELVMVKQPARFAKAPLRSNFQEYPKEFFLRDLAKLVASGSFATTSGKRLVLAPTAFSADAFPILEAGAIRYIGRIAFADASE